MQFTKAVEAKQVAQQEAERARFVVMKAEQVSKFIPRAQPTRDVCDIVMNLNWDILEQNGLQGTMASLQVTSGAFKIAVKLGTCPMALA